MLFSRSRDHHREYREILLVGDGGRDTIFSMSGQVRTMVLLFVELWLQSGFLGSLVCR